MEKRRAVATSCGGEGGWKPGVQVGFRSRLSPDPACFLTRTQRRRAGAQRIPKPSRSHTVGCCYTMRRAAVAAHRRLGQLPRRPQIFTRAHPFATGPEVPPASFAAVPYWVRRLGLTAGWPTADVSLERPLRPPQGGRSRDPLRRGVERERRGQRRGAESDRAVGGTSAWDPEGAAPRLVGVVVRLWLGGSPDHARCTKACFTSVTTGELGFLFSPFVPS